MSQQLSQPNFIQELLDIRFMKECASRGFDFDDVAVELLAHLFVDIRQDTNYQLAGGNVSIMAGSRVYSYLLDRVLTGAECMQMNGWSVLDTIMEGVNVDAVGRITSEVTGQPQKKRRGKMPENDIALADLAGNAQCLPDLSLFTLPLIFVLQRPGLFEKPFDLHAILALFSNESVGVVELDPNLTQKELRKMRDEGAALNCETAEASPEPDVPLDSGSDRDNAGS